MKTFKEFRRDWVLDPSKEMIVEKEIVSAYARYIEQESDRLVIKSDSRMGMEPPNAELKVKPKDDVPQWVKDLKEGDELQTNNIIGDVVEIIHINKDGLVIEGNYYYPLKDVANLFKPKETKEVKTANELQNSTKEITARECIYKEAEAAWINEILNLPIEKYNKLRREYHKLKSK